MILNLLVLPLAAGYYILTKSYKFRYRTQRLDRNSLFFETVICAVFILIGAFFIKLFLYDQFITNSFKESFRALNPLKTTPLSGLVGLSFLLVVLITYLSNFLLDREQEIHAAIIAIGNEFELLASKAIKEEKLILLSLKNDKFYIGWVKELPIPSQSNYLRIIPVFSGYRDKEKRLQFTSQYIEAYSLLIEDGQGSSFNDFNSDVVMPISEIITISFYDQEIYDILN